MSLPPSVDALRNERTGKLFIVVDWDIGDNQIKVVNPTGSILDVTKLILKVEEPIKVASSDFASSFSPEQIKKLENWDREILLHQPKKAPAKKSSGTTRARAKSSRTEGVIDKKSSSAGKRPAVQWSSSELTFYRHHIEKLKSNDVFAIVVEGIGTFQLSKAEFQRVFNNVIMNPEYRDEGVYRYPAIPEEAKVFLRT